MCLAVCFHPHRCPAHYDGDRSVHAHVSRLRHDHAVFQRAAAETSEELCPGILVPVCMRVREVSRQERSQGDGIGELHRREALVFGYEHLVNGGAVLSSDQGWRMGTDGEEK